MPSSTPEDGPALWPLIAVPAAITLAITALRLTGEMLHWSPRFFSREAGGGLAVVGIAWLVPLFGIWFACWFWYSPSPVCARFPRNCSGLDRTAIGGWPGPLGA